MYLAAQTHRPTLLYRLLLTGSWAGLLRLTHDSCAKNQSSPVVLPTSLSLSLSSLTVLPFRPPPWSPSNRLKRVLWSSPDCHLAAMAAGPAVLLA